MSDSELSPSSCSSDTSFANAVVEPIVPWFHSSIDLAIDFPLRAVMEADGIYEKTLQHLPLRKRWYQTDRTKQLVKEKQCDNKQLTRNCNEMLDILEIFGAAKKTILYRDVVKNLNREHEDWVRKMNLPQEDTDNADKPGTGAVQHPEKRRSGATDSTFY